MLILLPESASQLYSQTVKNGIIDLRNYNFEKDGNLELNGDWDFNLWKFVDPLKPGYKNLVFPRTIYAPHKKINFGQVEEGVPALSYGTYRLKILLNKKYLKNKNSLAILVPGVMSSYNMWIDTSLAAQRGVLGKADKKNIPYLESKIISFYPLNDTTIVTIQYQNSLLPITTGIIMPVSIGHEPQIVQKESTRKYFYLSGAIFSFTTSIFFIILALMVKEKRISLLTFLICLIVALRYLFDEAYFITQIIPGIDPAIILKFIIGLAIFFGVVFVLAYSYFPEEINKNTVKIVFSFYLIYSLIVITTPLRFSALFIPYILAFSYLLFCYTVYKLYPAYRNKKEISGWMISLLLYTILIGTVNVVFPYTVTPIGTLVHIILFTILVIKKLSVAQNRVIRLSKDLQVINENLEIIVRERTEELETANNLLKKLNFAKDRFIGILSHDLRNPLSYLVGITERLIKSAKKKDYEQTVGYSELIHESAVKGYNLAESLLDWSLIQSGLKGIQPEAIELKSFTYGAIEFHRNEFELKNISVVSRIECEQNVYADERMLQSIFRNLLTNAIKFTPAGGTVEISTEIKDGNCIVSITDSGIGIPRETIENLFRIDKKIQTFGTNDETGSGFGLIITKELIEYNGGAISIVSEEGKGTIVSFTLPVNNTVKVEN